jgi:hypothetical protein
MFRWNIYHILASGKAALFEHFLKKLPREVSESLLLQQSKHRLETVNVFTLPSLSVSNEFIP